MTLRAPSHRALRPTAGARRRWLAWALGLGLLLPGCAAVLPNELLPEEPLVFVHRSLAQGRDRADYLKKSRGEPGEAGEGVMTLESAEELLDRMRSGRRELPTALQGRLAFYHPRTQEIAPIPAFGYGAFGLGFDAERSRLLVASRHRGTARLYEYSVVRRDVAPSVGGHAQVVGGAFGPDGRMAWVTGVRRQRGGVELSVWAHDAGGAPRRLTPGPRDSSVAWSPDGRTLLIQSVLANGRSVIQSLDPDDELAEPQVIARGREPAFAPSGDWVVYSRERPEGWRLWRMRADGTGKTALGFRPQGQADERHPTVSPDGRYVAYVAEEDDRQRIRIRGMDGSGDRLLIEDADGTLPVW